MAKKSKKFAWNAEGMWRMLIIFNLVMTSLGFWMIYMQNNYILSAIESNLPVSVPAPYKGTAIVTNPLTGQLITVQSTSLVSISLGFFSLVGFYLLLDERV